MVEKVLQAATDAAIRITGKQYCRHHQGEVPVEKGEYILRAGKRMWVCFMCRDAMTKGRAAAAKRNAPSALSKGSV